MITVIFALSSFLSWEVPHLVLFTLKQKSLGLPLTIDKFSLLGNFYFLDEQLTIEISGRSLPDGVQKMLVSQISRMLLFSTPLKRSYSFPVAHSNSPLSISFICLLLQVSFIVE